MTTKTMILEALAETEMQTEGMQLSLQLQHHLYYSPSDQLASPQIFDMLVKELGLDFQSAEGSGTLLLSGNGCTLHQHQNPTVDTILEAH
jgi:hypothetical protein